jgi:REP-associated tyrosine transposase
VAQAWRELKAGASGWMHDVFPSLSNFSWQRGYAAFTVSQSNLQHVQRYLKNQKEHHRRVPFRDEFIQFLKTNQIEFDSRITLMHLERTTMRLGS